MLLISAISSNWKNIIKQSKVINTFTTTHRLFIQNSRAFMVQKVTSKELYWIFTTTTGHKPTSQKYFEKKFNDLSLDCKKIHMTPRTVSSNICMRCFQYKVLKNALFRNKKLFPFQKSNSPMCSFC